jgi:hypothetical protein
MATPKHELTISIPSEGRVYDVLVALAARDGYGVGRNATEASAGLSAWLRAHLQELARQQLRSHREQLISDAEAAIETDLATIT